MGKKKSKSKGFKYLTGEEIYGDRALLNHLKDDEEYNEFCKKMNKFWDHNSVEEQLVKKGFAKVTSILGHTAEHFNFSKCKQLQSKLLSYSELKTNFKIGEDLYYDSVSMIDNKYSTFSAMIFRDVFELDLDMFDRFINENEFYWNLGLMIEGVGRRSICDASTCIYKFRFVIFIACDTDDATVTSIKLGLENLGSVEKAPKRVRLTRALSYHFGSIDFDPQLVSAMTAWVLFCIILVACILRVAAMGSMM